MSSHQCSFAGIYRDTTPLVTCSLEAGTWDRVFLNMCDHGKIKDGTQIMNVNGYLWGILREKEGLTFLIVNKGFTQIATEEALQRLKSDFIRANLNWRTAEQLSLMSEYEGKLSDFMYKISQQAKISAIQSNMVDTQESMKATYEEVLTRGMNMDNLTSLSDQLETNATIYKEEATDLRRKMFWRKYRLYFLIGLLAIAFIYILLVVGCGGFDLKPNCIHEDKPQEQTTQ